MNEHRNQNVDWRYADVAKMAVLVPTARGENLYLCSTRTLTPPNHLLGDWLEHGLLRLGAQPIPLLFLMMFTTLMSPETEAFSQWTEGGRQLADEW